MPPRSTRQRKLPDGEPPRLANYQVVRKPLLSASTLASWLYCHTKPFVERILQQVGIDTSTYAMRLGAEAHAQVQGALEAVAAPSDLTLAQALARKQFLFETETHLLDERRRLHGYVDIIFTRLGRLHILELKNTRAPAAALPPWNVPVWPEHGVQLHVYGILGRSVYGATPHLALSYLRGGSKEAVLGELSESSNPEAALARLDESSIALPHAAPERAQVLAQVAAFQRDERGSEVPDPDHANPRKCAGCGVRAWCVRRLDQPGRFLELDASLLDPEAPSRVPRAGASRISTG